jgi:hypothetical protein
MKTRLNRGKRPSFYFWRDSNGNEAGRFVVDGSKEEIN